MPGTHTVFIPDQNTNEYKISRFCSAKLSSVVSMEIISKEIYLKIEIVLKCIYSKIKIGKQ